MKQDIILPVDPTTWLKATFDCPAARNGGVIRTTLATVEDHVGLERFIREVQARGYRAVENAGHIIVFCNRDPVMILRPKPVQAAAPRAH
jgi:hypothetical protein